MLNPDGVIAGNYRTSLVGSDLNRRWKTPSKQLHPTIYYAKSMIKNFAAERPIELVCDLHGHSKHKNVFMYGCNVQGQPEATRALPFILSKISPWFFYDYCSFKV
jgi:murein tripeptide amidase MpaA